MTNEEFETLLNFFKVMGNEKRLKIAGILANRDCTVRELAQMLKLKEPTVSEHLGTLKMLGLVTVRPEGNFRVYSFNSAALHTMNREMLSRGRLANLVQGEVEDSDQKVMKAFFKGDQLIAIPASRKKWLIILRWFAEKFEDGIQYPEKQVNEIILHHHGDYALIRRELVDWKFMTREKSIYWKLPTPTDLPLD